MGAMYTHHHNHNINGHERPHDTIASSFKCVFVYGRAGGRACVQPCARACVPGTREGGREGGREGWEPCPAWAR